MWPDMPEEAEAEEAAMHVDEWDEMYLESEWERRNRRWVDGPAWDEEDDPWA